MKNAATLIRDIGIIPVIRAPSAQHVLPAVESLSSGGIPIVEITMTVPGAIDLIAELCRRMDHQVLIGAGTVLDAETAERCIDAGAQFVVTPGLDLDTIQTVKERKILMIAGALTPTEIISAWKSGADFVKIFPCSSLGGAKYLKALKAPLPQIPMIPTGGVNLTTLVDFIRAGAEAVGVGEELVSKAALASTNKDQITDLASHYLALVREARRIY